VTTHPALVDRPSADDPATAVDELSLAALLDLFTGEDPPAVAARPSLRAAGLRAYGWLQRSARRAAAWGAVRHETTGAR
jgi:hypothetical protein